MRSVAQDADKQKLIETERAFFQHANPSPQEAADMERYLRSGPLNQFTPFGQLRTVAKSRVVENSSNAKRC